MVRLKAGVDVGLLILRVGLGGMFFFVHGLPKIMAGPAMWSQIGSAMGHLGISVWPVFWGLLAALAEGLGGLLLALGVGTRTAAVFMAFTMAVAAAHHLMSGDSFAQASHAVEDGIVFFALIWLGSGKYALRPSR